MKRVFETAECEGVRNSVFLVQRYDRHENQMKGCGVELKVSDWLADKRLYSWGWFIGCRATLEKTFHGQKRQEMRKKAEEADKQRKTHSVQAVADKLSSTVSLNIILLSL